MYVTKLVFKVILVIFLSFLILNFFYFFIKTFVYKVKLKLKVKDVIKQVRYNKFIDFVKWVSIDIYRRKDRFRLFGIWAFTGYYGEGKTLGCVTFAHMLQEKHPERDIKIYSNINVVGQIKRIEHWEELLDLPPNSIFIYDESQSDFSCNNKDFPEDFLRKITQCRKKQFAMFMTSPKFNRMNINIRESVNYVIECKNFMSLDRAFVYKFYNTDKYEEFRDSSVKLSKHRLFTIVHIASDDDYASYDTVEEVKSIRAAKENLKLKNDSKVYNNLRNEMYKVFSNN